MGRAPWTRLFGTETRRIGDARADIDVDVTPRANIVRTIPSERGVGLFWDGLDIIDSSSAKIWSTKLRSARVIILAIRGGAVVGRGRHGPVKTAY
jgi:hypothetical protein